jgi:ABC-type transport system involved in multi-copper enzyme maturation permease subunit
VRATLILAEMTFREAIRRRIALAGLVLGVCFLIIFSAGFYLIGARSATLLAGATTNPGIAQIGRVEEVNTLLLAGLYTVTFLSIAMAALLGADTLAGQISSGSIQTLVTKPIRRAHIVLGKWVGFAALLGLYLLLMAGGTMLSVWVQSGYTAPHLFIGLGLMYMESLLVMTISLLCSARLSALATGGVVFGLYGLAFIGGWVEQFGSLIQDQTAVKVGILTSLIIPSEALWRRAAFEMQSPLTGSLGLSPFGTVSVPSLLMIAYSGLYLVAALALALRTFQRRDL